MKWACSNGEMRSTIAAIAFQRGCHGVREMWVVVILGRPLRVHGVSSICRAVSGVLFRDDLEDMAEYQCQAVSHAPVTCHFLVCRRKVSVSAYGDERVVKHPISQTLIPK